MLNLINIKKYLVESHPITLKNHREFVKNLLVLPETEISLSAKFETKTRIALRATITNTKEAGYDVFSYDITQPVDGFKVEEVQSYNPFSCGYLTDYFFKVSKKQNKQVFWIGSKKPL